MVHLQRRVLVAGCDAESLHMLTGVLKDWDLEPLSVTTVKEAQTALDGQDLALVLCEGQLPDGSFRDLLDTATSRKPPLRVVVLARGEKDYVDAIRLGAFDAIPAPFRRSDVQWMMIQALRNNL
jgi:DNA-binding NtrC family response regulator